MDQNKIIEGNIIIAKFMQWGEGESSTDDCIFYEVFNEPADQRTADELCFHSDWNWLMEAVDKIRAVKSYDGGDIFGTDVTINRFCKIKSGNYGIKGKAYPMSEYFENVYHALNGSSILSVFIACVEFIKWYNKK